ncbi:glutamine--fructose-6-phosphate transaminase (isomerizing) [Candidatus Daviesbacteria bacterium]|nr:glutamine--fructose-6-phosphate transaminase (isomerizing) [Candidatus Daviesbacteria bacterium]
MCGIFGYSGPKNASQIILEGLKRLEYRGYDSWGIALGIQNSKFPGLAPRSGAGKIQNLFVEKHVGAIGDIKTFNFKLLTLNSHVGIGHTRWATHGGITEVNAHPHCSSDKSFCLAQNGIVENYQKLKQDLVKLGYKFQTQTDTEVIVRLIEHKFSLQPRRPSAVSLRPNRLQGNLMQSVREAFLELEGRNTIIVLNNKGGIIAARNGSPLVVGLGSQARPGVPSEVYFSSDTLSFAPFVEKIVVIDNGQMVYLKNHALEILDIKSNKTIPYSLEKINFKSSKVEKQGYSHFMLKEICESPYVIRQVLNQNLKQYQIFAKALKRAKNIYTIGSGTAGIAASQIAFYLRIFGKIKAQSVIGADIYDYFDLLGKGDVMIAPSQSGETADVLEVLEIAKRKGVKIASYVNMPGSTMSRMSDYKFASNAGPEICVMSTKVFTSQIAWGYLLGKVISGKGKVGRENLKNLADQIEQYLVSEKNHRLLKNLAKKLAHGKDIFLLGKYQNLNIVKEGMVKIIEGSYIHAHGIPAGDLKHYAITLMEKGVPVIFAVSEDVSFDDVINAVNQVKARGATVIGISAKPHSSFDYHIPVPDSGETSAIMNIIPLQVLAYYMAVQLGHNVDKPRNIAKSVTVK